MFVIDHSDSMTLRVDEEGRHVLGVGFDEGAPLVMARDVAQSIVDRLDPSLDRISVKTIDNELLEFTSDFSMFASSLDGDISDVNNVPVAQGIDLAINEFNLRGRPLQDADRIIIHIGDGPNWVIIRRTGGSEWQYPTINARHSE